MPRPGSPGSVGAHVPHIDAAGGSERHSTVTPFERFLLWERSSRDTIEVKRTYIDIAGDLVAGILLSQIVYWHLPDRDGKSRLRVQREGKLWIAKGRTEWWDECRVSPKQVDRALETLRRRNVIETRLFKFNGSPTVHVRLDEVGFMAQWEDHLEHPEGGNGTGTVPDFPLRAKSNSPTGENPSSGQGQTHLAGQVRTSTESTAENTAETTTTTGTARHGDADDGVVVALLGSLTQAGVTRKRAEALLANHAADEIRSQLAMLGYRKADDPAAVLVRAIEEEWAPPAEYRRAQAEREKEERQRLRREQKAREQAEHAAVEEAQRAGQDEWWNALDSEEQDELNAQAEAALRQNTAFLFRSGEPKRNGVMYQTMFDAERRRLIAERMHAGE